jgi:hypothetical protein
MKGLTWKQVLSLVLLAIIILYMFPLIAFSAFTITDYGLIYYLMYYLPKILPFVIMWFYCFADFKINFFNKIFNHVSFISLILACGLALVLLFGVATKLPLSFLFGNNYSWSYDAALEWSLCFVALWFITKLKTSSSLAALTFAAIGISAGGNLHEMVFGLFNINQYFHITYPVILATPLVSIIFVAVLMKDQLWKNNLFSIIAFIGYLCFTILYATIFNPNVHGIHFQVMWIQRLPTILLLLSIPFGFRKENQNATS